jgi:hypothetical protein
LFLLSSNRVTIRDILGEGESAEKCLSIFGEPSNDDSDLFSNATRNRNSTDRPKHRASACSAQQEILNTFVPDVTINVRPLVVDLLPVLRGIAKSEEARYI